MSQTVERAIAVLEQLSTGPKQVAEIAAGLSVHRTTALRLLQDLSNGGLARRREDGTYAIGYRLAGLAQAALEQFDLREISHPHIAALGRELGLTVHIAVITGNGIVYADKFEPHGTVRLYSEVGKPVRLHASGVGKVLLAFAPEHERRRLLDGHAFERFTATTIADPAAFERELATIRERGHSTDDGEYETFVNCIGVPIRDGSGEVRTALSVTALREQTDLSALTGRLPKVIEAAEAIEYELGRRG